jgi:TonB-linked SusC/RagA family outer membrane protein
MAAAQQRSVTGRVTDANNQPVSGASVVVRGTTIGTSTDAQGRFTISVPANATTLTISYVGFDTKDVSISGQQDVAVSLAGSQSAMNEVVVVGYTSQRRRDVTGAVTSVNVSDLKSVPAADATSQLQGRASGVTVIQNGVPGAGANVRIRGLGSFNNNNPLYVIDGVQAGNINGLNPNDIESFQVLKDAASASIYGVRGSNGVIVITTKKGKRGNVGVSYDMYYGSQNPGDGFDLLNAQEEAELFFLARKNSGLATTGSVFGNGSTPVLPDYIFYSGAANNGVPIMAGNPGVDPSKYNLDYNLLGDPSYSPYIIVPTSKGGTNWYNEVTRNAPIQSHNLTVSGGGENSRILLSLNYFNQQAITNYQFYKRYTARMNSEFTILKNIRIGENLQVYSSEANVPRNGTDGDQNNNQEASIIAQTFRPMSIIPVYTIRPGDFAGTAGGWGYGTWGNAKNPVAQLYRNRNNRNNNVNFLGNVYAEVDFLRHFTARTSFGGIVNVNNRYEYPFIEYEHVENNANTTYNERFVRNNNWIWTNQLTYKNTFGDHNITVLAGEEAQKGDGRQIIGAATTLFTYNYLPFINLGNGTTQNLGGSSSFAPVTTVSYFAKADYSFKGKYLLSALVRRDGSSKFLPDYRWGTFPAFSLGYRISDESFMKDMSWLTELKIRGSWGKMGNEAAVSAGNAFTTFSSNRQSSWYDIGGTQNAPQEGFFLNFNANPIGTWEKNTTSNIGFDATIFKSTDIVFDFYKRKTEDLLYNPTRAGIYGSATVPFENVGSMENHGIDVMVTNRANISKDVRLNTTLTFTTYSNKITGITEDGQKYFDFNSMANEANRIGGNITRNFLGSPLNTFYGYKVVGLFQSAADVSSSPTQDGAAPGRFKYADINGDKKIDADDRTIIGNPNPDFTYGINLGVEAKGFDVTAFFYGVQGKDAFNLTRWWTDFSSGFPGGRSKRALYESWLPDGSRPNATTPIQETTAGTSSSGVVNSYYVENASYFRMRNLQIGYTLPASLTNKVRISRARIYVQATNLFTITKYTGLDPDIISGDDRAASIDIGAYPTVRQFTVGANINF